MLAGRALVAAVLLASAGTARAQDLDCHVAPARPGPITTTAASSGGDVTLTVAALYTPEAADSAIGRGAPIGQWIADAFAAWQVVIDSAAAPGPAVTVQPVGVVSLDLPETGACFADLDAFFAHPRSAVIRDSLAANLVVLFTARCSAAYQCTETSDCEASAYATARFAVAGAPTAEGGHALAHEAGHLLGMRHDIDADPTPGYNHGYRNETAGFFTVMAFRGPLPRTDMVSTYSDPRRTFEGSPLGTADVADNARVLREMAPVAATWNTDVPNEPGPGARGPVLRVSPNPARGAWRVDVAAPGPGAVRLELADALGRGVWSESLIGAGPWSVAVPAHALAPGVYLLRGSWDDGVAVRYATLHLAKSR